MSLIDALTQIATLGPFVFAAGIVTGYRSHLGRTHHDR